MILDIYDSHKNFNAEFEFYCFKNCYRQILEHYRVKNGIYYLDCTSDWIYQESNQNSFGYNFSSGDTFSNFLPPFDTKVKIYNEKNISKDDIWKINKQKIIDGIPLVAAVDVFYLDYTPYFNKKHSFHSLLFCGFSEENEELYIVDWYTPWFYKGTISMHNFNQARSSDNPAGGILSGTPIEYMWTEVDNMGWDAEDVDLISTAIELSLDRFYSIHKDDGLTFKGVNALNKLLFLVEKNYSMDGISRRQFLEDMHGKLYFTPTRKNLFKYYVETVLRDFEYPKLKLSLNALNDTIDSWKKILSLIIKCSIANTEANYLKIVDHFKELILKEKNFYYILFEANKTIKAL